ncbi:MAG TPA: FlgD immunoglobulin-like domain containing protein [Candidatus Krumholzibacteria bacterium]|nr:FlgD immunoglobulin-like domain containing protein [Candidatus Krumholzibacteria bacterium]HRX50647.1 FlgD immunoglobulin-like domain containing protein [Candidatus Krumholzibacteria bacterium]
MRAPVPAVADAAPAPSRPVPTLRRGATLTAGGVLDKDALWDAATVDVVEDLTLIDGAVLTIAAGVTVRFHGYVGMLVRDGTILASGTPQAPILWTTSDPDAYDPGPGDAGCWNGLTFLNVPAAREPSRLEWCEFRHAKALPGRGLDDDDPRVGGRAFRGAGGALRLVGGDPVRLTGCVFRENSAERGGALATHYGASPVLSECLFLRNVGRERAGAVFAGYGRPRFVHATLLENVCANSDVADRTAGAVDHFHASPAYLGCVVWGNVSSHVEHLQLLEARALDVVRCDVQDYGLGMGGMDVDPLLSWMGDIGAGSPCVDAGDHAAAAAWLPEVDLAGRPRAMGGEIDLGCYESGAATAVAPAPASTGARAWPNPANPRVTVAWRQTVAGGATLEVMDLAGRCVRRLDCPPTAAGERRADWDGRDARGHACAAGTYLVRIRHPLATDQVRIVLVR